MLDFIFKLFVGVFALIVITIAIPIGLAIATISLFAGFIMWILGIELETETNETTTSSDLHGVS